MTNHEIIISDMSACRPAACLSLTPRPRQWQLAPYQTDTIQGTMILARPQTNPPEVVLPLPGRGRYAIHLAFAGVGWCGPALISVKLGSDPCPVRLGVEADFRFLEEGFWKEADLDGATTLHIAPVTEGDGYFASLAYVRLTPVAGPADDGRDCRRLIVMMGGSAADVRSLIEPFRDSDVGRVFLECWQGDKSCYPAAVGRLFGQETTEFPQPLYRHWAESCQALKAQGVDLLQVACEHAHALGIELFAGMRMGFFGMCPPCEVFEGPFFPAHPELRCRDRDGAEVSRLSYGFPETRAYVLELLKDLLRYDIDGMNLIFRRGQPFVLYEEPLVAAFREETGIDPLTLGEQDARWRWYEREFIPNAFWFVCVPGLPSNDDLFRRRCLRIAEFSEPVRAWLRFRATAVTRLLRALRALLESHGRPRKIAAVVFGNEADNLFYGLDVEIWAREGLVDILVPYTSPDMWPQYSQNDMEFFAQITRDAGCELYPNIMPRSMTPDKYLEKAIAAYNQGADGLAFWDGNGRAAHLNQWAVVRHLGHRADLAMWREKHRFEVKLLPLRRLGDYTIDRFHPAAGG